MENDRIWYARKTMLVSGRPHFDWSGISHKHYTMISASSGHQIKIPVLRTSSPKWKFINQYQPAPGFNSLGMRNKTNDKKMSACYHFMTPKTQHNTSQIASSLNINTWQTTRYKTNGGAKILQLLYLVSYITRQ